MKVEKGRCWSALAWCESVPVDWKDRLKRSGLECVVSPLHDKDVDEKTGESQKSHYHVMIRWDGPTTLESAREFAQYVGLGTYVERVRSTKNLLDYLTHNSYSSKGKAKYSTDEIEYINCVESDFINTGFKKIVAYIRDNKIKTFNKLIDVLYLNNEDELLMYVSQHPYYVNLYVSSLKLDLDKDLKQTYSMLKDLANDIDKRGCITVNKKDYFRLLEYFEQIDIWMGEN